MEALIKNITDFITWLLFISTLLSAIILLIIATYELIQGLTPWTLYTGSIVSLVMHTGVRYLPTTSAPKNL